MAIEPQRLKRAIIEKFGSQAEFARKTGYQQAQISRAIKTQSIKFMTACKKAGIDVDRIIFEEQTLPKDEIGKKLIEAYKRIKELESLVEDQREIIQAYKEIQKDKKDKKK